MITTPPRIGESRILTVEDAGFLSERRLVRWGMGGQIPTEYTPRSQGLRM